MAPRLQQAGPLNASRAKNVKMAESKDVNIASSGEVATLFSFIEEPSLTGVLKAAVLDDDEEDAIRLATAADEEHDIPVRIEGYGDFVVPRYAEAVFKEHFRMCRSTFDVC